MSKIPKDGKLFVAANPWPLAAEAQRQRVGIPTERFVESDLVPEGQVVVCDLDALLKLTPESFEIPRA